MCAKGESDTTRLHAMVAEKEVAEGKEEELNHIHVQDKTQYFMQAIDFLQQNSEN